jgi:hypothetical protein
MSLHQTPKTSRLLSLVSLSLGRLANTCKGGTMQGVLTRVTSLVLIAFLAAALLSCKNPTEQTAIQAATSWLSLVDEEKYPESWVGLAGLFKKDITKEEWIHDLNRFRKPLGNLVERKLQHKSKSSGASVGEYLIFQYETSFEKKTSVLEVVSLIKDKDGNWKILGYGIPAGQ